MTKVRVVHHEKGYLAIENRISNVGYAITVAVAQDARKGAPVDTGALRESIRVVTVSRWSWYVIVGTGHWSHQEYGTLGRDPIIVPKFKKALWWKGLPFPVARVDRHPGNKAKPFMRPAVYQRRAFWVAPATGRVWVIG